jgi:hypothetical protein
MLLVVDGHAMHSENLEAVEALEDEVVVLQLPDRATHRLEPFDVAISIPLETFCSRQSING